MTLTEHTEHRPYPLPSGPWIMAQTWSNLLFAHWPIPPDAIRPYLPSGLELDTFDGYAWLGIVPFEMHNIHLRWLPPIPYASEFAELNVRTYVIADGKPGVYFFSLDAASPLAVAAARRFFHLPYFNANMHVHIGNDGLVQYKSIRTHRKMPQSVFTGSYRPISKVYFSQSGTLEYWLTERYCLYSRDRKRQIYRGDIHHLPWPLQQAEAEITENTLPHGHGLELPDARPILHFVKTIDVLVWPLVKIETK